jgi:DNA transposition AAA+ family ATPase
MSRVRLTGTAATRMRTDLTRDQTHPIRVHARHRKAPGPLPQLYSRIGFVHEYRPLSADELAFVPQRHWATLGLELSADDFTDTEVIAAVRRITSGNFRLVQRLFAQITRVLEINGLRVISREVVETARESLVIGTL